MIVDIKDIRIEKKDENTRRFRNIFGDIYALSKSIKERGLLHPPVISLDETGEKKYVLIAGERRIRACLFNGMMNIPVTLKDDMTEFDRKMCELEENTIREDLDWKEQIEAMRQLDELKRKQHGESTQSRNNKGWTIEDTASFVGVSKSSAGQDIKLARDLVNRPDLLKKVSSLPKHAARKIVKQTMEEEVMQRQINRNDMVISADLLLGRCEELIDTVDDESVDLWLTDPPFADAHIVGLSGTNSPSAGMPLYNLTASNVGDDKDMTDVYRILIPKVFKKLKPGAHIYVFFGHSWYCRLSKMLRDAGFIIDDQPIIWHKGRPSVMAKDMHYMSSYEAVFFGYKPPIGRILAKPITNVITIPSIHAAHRVHPLQRPHSLLKIFIENSTGVGDLVLDTFAGSASTLVSAKRLQRRAIGFEKDEGNYLRAQAWMNKENGE